jgi:ATP-dependent helicase/nuclease subunit B
MNKAPRVFSIPAAEPFLEKLVETLLNGKLVPDFPRSDDLFSLARATIYLPTRRSCRELSDLFRKKNIVPHPKLKTFGDFDEEEAFFNIDTESDTDGLGLPFAITGLERQVILSRLILQWSKSLQKSGVYVPTPSSPVDAVYLAGELAHLLDMITHEGLEASALQELAPPELQEHWDIAYRFLKIASEAWPNYLRAARQIEPAEHRRLVMRDEAERLMIDKNNPVIAAGSTGSVPITAEFLIAIAHHPRGALVLPGLDRDLDETSWQLISKAQEPGHPQASLAMLLQKLKITREEVEFLEGAVKLRARERLLSQTLRPAITSEVWGSNILSQEEMKDALADVALVEAAHMHEEALVIAYLLRETLEKSETSAALITPDRVLARLVGAELQRFGLQADDSAGRPLHVTQAGIFARLLAETALNDFASSNLLSLLKHPLCRLGQKEDDVEQINGAIERVLLRGFAGGKTVDALLHRFDENIKTQSAKDLNAGQRQRARIRFERLCSIMQPFMRLLQIEDEQPLNIFLKAHLEALLSCTASFASEGKNAVPSSADGKELLDFFSAMDKAHSEYLLVKGADYPSLFNAFAAKIAVRSAQTQKSRVFIYGLPEARLMRHDRLVLGGLNEGVWPGMGKMDLWLSRSMRGALGLPLPERRIGLAAHDFSQGLGTKDVWLTRALKSSDSPSSPSRFLQRLAAVVGEGEFNKMRERGMGALQTSRLLNTSNAVKPAARPAPSPPLKARPRQLSVTQVEKLLSDPYTIYATHVLRLYPFEPLDKVFDARQRGIVIHAILSDFAKVVSLGEKLSEDLLTNIALRHFQPYFENAEVKAFWWPRFCMLIPELLEFETNRRKTASSIITEASGILALQMPAGAFSLSARADRIEKKAATYALIDFKTGQLPEKNKIGKAFALQLTLQAAMLEAGAFGEFKGTSDELIYVGLAKADHLEFRKVEQKDLMAFARDTLSSVQEVIKKFDEGAPYISRADSPYAKTSNDYLHLSRVREWGFAGADEV